MSSIPWTYSPRPDTATSNVRLGVWLFLASEAMFFGSLLSAYVLLRTSALSWPATSDVLNVSSDLLKTVVLLAATASLRWAKPSRAVRATVAAATLGTVFVAMKVIEYQARLAAGLPPSGNMFLACWFTLTGLHALHVVAGVIACVWVAATSGAVAMLDRTRERLVAVRLYWYFVDVVWLLILASFYLV